MTRWLPVAALVLVLTRPGFAATRLAVLGDRDPVVERVVALLEPGLAEMEGVQLVEREQLPAVLREQELAAGFAAEGVGRRVSLGRLLRADLLVMLRTSGGRDKHFDLVVCETHQGLRLLAEPVALGKDADSDVAALRPRVLAAVKRWGQPRTAVVAVPPLVCDDFAFAFAPDGAAYARVIEAALLARRGVVVVEWAEARALALELAVAAQPAIDRPLPLYLLGSYHNTGSGDARRLSFGLTLNQAGRVIAKATRNGIEPDRAAASLRDAIAALPDVRLGPPPAAPDPHAEATQLYERGSLFLRLGQPGEALPLCEASLLLRPSGAAHRDAAEAIITLWQTERDRTAPPVSGKRSPAAEQKVWERYLPLLRLGLEHVQAYMKAGPITSPNDPVIGRYLRAFPADEAGAMLLRVARARYDAQVEDLTLDFARGLRWSTLPGIADRYTLATSLAVTVVGPRRAGAKIAYLFSDIDEGKASPELSDALDRLGASENPLARQAARLMQDRVARGLTVTGGTPAAGTARLAATRAVAVAGEVKVIPLDLGIGRVDGIMPCGEGADAVWGPVDGIRADQPDTLYLLKASAPPRLVCRCPRTGAPAFDGRYLWAAGEGARGPEVLIVDPVTEKIASLTPCDGLPGEPIRAFAAAPLGAGKVCAAAQVEHDGARRTWVALLSFGPTAGPTFVPLHEAHLTKPAAGMSTTDPAVSFPPHAAVVLRPPGVAGNGPACVAAFRSGGVYHSVSFPDPESLRSGRGVVVRYEPALTRPQASADQGWDFEAGRQYWIAAGRGPTPAEGELRYDALGEAPRTAATGIPAGVLAVTAAGVYVYSPDLNCLFRADGPGGPFRRCPLLLPPGFGSGGRQFARSNRYGLLLFVGPHLYRFEDADGRPLPWKRP